MKVNVSLSEFIKLMAEDTVTQSKKNIVTATAALTHKNKIQKKTHLLQRQTQLLDGALI